MCAMMQLILSLSEGASVICAFRSLPQGQKSPFYGLFCMFRLAEHSPRDALRRTVSFKCMIELFETPYSQGGPSGEGHLRLEMVPLPGAPRTADSIRSERCSLSFQAARRESFVKASQYYSYITDLLFLLPRHPFHDILRWVFSGIPVSSPKEPLRAGSHSFRQDL